MSHLQPGDRVPEVIFKTRVRDEALKSDNPYRWQDLSTNEIFAGKKIVLFALPGAFTPTCSTRHAPGYDATYNDFKNLGIDEVICLSVNDAFVMFKWHLDVKTENLFMLPDGNGDFTRAMGMMVEKTNLGFGNRSWRYSMYVEDGIIKKMFVEEKIMNNSPTDPFEISDAQTMLNALKEQNT